MQEIIETKQFFENYEIKLSDFWLESCICWFHQENGNAPYTTKELRTKVYEQWLLLDLRDVDIPQLPPNVNSEKKIVLNQSLSLQMMSVVDISKSKFNQIQKIKNLNELTRGFDDEKEIGPISKRMLQLTLTDGIQEVKAIEYKPIPALDINLAPGVKIKINAPITLRRGQMMLEQYNVKLLGGEVEEILVSHAAENILARYLNLPENPHPITVDESILELGETANTSDGTNISWDNKKDNVTDNRNAYSINKNVQQCLTTNYCNTNRIQTSTNKRNSKISEEEEIQIAAEMDMLLEVERDIFEQNSRKETIEDESKLDAEIEMLLEAERDILEDSIRRKNLNDETQPDNKVKMLKEIENAATYKNASVKKMYRSTTPDMFDNCEFNGDRESQIKNQSIDNEEGLNCSLEIEDELFNSFQMDQHLDKIEESYHTHQNIPIKDILDNIRNSKFGKYKTHAKFKSIIQKMTVKNDKWIVEICITDGNNDLAVYVHSDVVNEMAGLTATEAMKLKQRIENKNAEATHTIMKALDQFKDKLIQLDCLIEIEFTGNFHSPLITKLV